jgi:peptidoglycan-associated lipoprotein
MKTGLRLLIVLALLGLFLGGCGCFQQQMKGETPPPAAPPPQVTAPEAKPEIPIQPAPLPSSPTPTPVAALKDINFDFDKSNIRLADAEVLRQNIAWFNANPGKTVKIEGNCDERGTVEYNLALGQSRSDSTKQFLVNLGVAANLMSTVSYGKEKPLCQEHNEECWAKNRRAHFVPIQ